MSPEPGYLPSHSYSSSAQLERSDRIAAVRLVIVEANRTKAELWQYFCHKYWGFDVVACCHTGSSGIEAVNQLKPELIFAGLRPMDLGLLEYIGGLRAAALGAKLVLFSTLCNEYLVHAVKPTEYHGFVYEPDETLSSLTTLIEKVRQGQRALSASIAQCQLQLRSMPTAFPKLLSSRHEQVLICIAHSMTDDEIAVQLGVSTATALSHRQKIMKKLNVHSTPKLIRYCTEKGFNSVPPPTPAAQLT
jgi:DNA-binding NarL/FixJ family response regulator